jgi:hypothetical protein
MKALSLMQPWAWLMVNGHKDIENRNWATLSEVRSLSTPAKLLTT